MCPYPGAGALLQAKHAGSAGFGIESHPDLRTETVALKSIRRQRNVRSFAKVTGQQCPEQGAKKQGAISGASLKVRLSGNNAGMFWTIKSSNGRQKRASGSHG